ncbi:MAG: hypothetical protein HY548_01150, partial [Elusimicrobia bacterium]|nr:hypothetical protein [Elusimicrobiota bacterium]
MADNKSQSTPQDKPNKKTLSPEELKRYYDLMEAQDLLELEIRHKDFFLRLTRKRPAGAVAPPAAGAVPPPAAPAAKAQIPEEQNQFHSIASPLAGVFYRAPSPKSDAFVKEGDKV